MCKKTSPKKDGTKKIICFYQDDKPTLNWKQIQGKWCYFDQDGNRLHSTVYKGYAFDQDRVMTENSWTKLDNQWYYADSSGRLSSEHLEKNQWSCAILTKLEACSTTPPLTAIFSQKAELWRKRAGLELNLVLCRSFWKNLRINGRKSAVSWYYFDKDGGMLSATTFRLPLQPEWSYGEKQLGQNQKDAWFYANRSGRYVQENWQKIQGSWYSFDQNGGILARQMERKLYLKASGAMAEKEWIFDKSLQELVLSKADGRYANQEWLEHTTSSRDLHGKE